MTTHKLRAIELVEKIYAIGEVRIELRNEDNFKITDFSITESKRYLDLLNCEIDSFFAMKDRYDLLIYVISLKDIEVVE